MKHFYTTIALLTWFVVQNSFAVPPAPTAEIIDGRYKILANGAEVKDLQTNLIWQRCQVGMTWSGTTCAGKAKKINFADAKKQAGNGWYVPTIRELTSLIYCSSGRMLTLIEVGDGGAPIKSDCDGNYTKPTINTQAFPNTPALYVWSGSPNANHSSYQWGVNFTNGSAGNDGRNDERNDHYGVRLVQSGR